MEQDHPASPTSVRYEPNDRPPVPLTVGLGLQFAILSIAGIVLTPAIVVRAAEGSEAYLSWAVFAAAAISGISTIGQAVRVGRIGAGYVLLMGTSGAFIAVCVAALVEGGPALMATLVVASSLFQFLLSSKLSLFRRLLTPTVAGTVLMLIAVTVMPLIFDMVTASPEGAAAASGPVCAAVTLAVVLVIALRSGGQPATVGAGHRHRRRIGGGRLLRHLRDRRHRRALPGSACPMPTGPASTSASAARSGRCCRRSSS